MQHSAWKALETPLAAIARDTIARQVGDRLPTVEQYQQLLGVGSGTVQSRLRQLARLGAIGVEARGHQGTRLVELDLARLWRIAGLGAARGILPLPEGFEPVALAVLLGRAFDRLGVPLELRYLHGSAMRIELVEAGEAQFALASQPAAEQAVKGHETAWLTLDFGASSYHREDSMVVLLRPHQGTDDRITKIGVDPDCHDHVALTTAEFPADEGYTYADYPHARLPTAVAEGIIDAAVWPRMSPVIPLAAVGIAVRPLHRQASLSLNRALSRAVVLARVGSPEIAAVLRTVDPGSIGAIQDEILTGPSLPMY
jgi:hypothetical protein